MEHCQKAFSKDFKKNWPSLITFWNVCDCLLLNYIISIKYLTMIKGFKHVSLLLVVLFSLSSFSSGMDITDPKLASLIKSLYRVNGGWKKLAAKRTVEFSYLYKDYQKGTDISKERYVFSDETSWAEYTRHEANVLPDNTSGIVRQLYMNGNSKIAHNGNMVSDPAAVGGTGFLRTANYYWFTMMNKLDDPGTIPKYLGQEVVNGINYDKVSLSYDGAAIGKEVNDEYILYFNPKTKLVDRFYFSLPALGVNQPAILMESTYEKIDGIYVSTYRKASFPDDKGNYAVGLEQFTTNVKFGGRFKDSHLSVQ